MATSLTSRWHNLPIRYKCALVVTLPVVCLLFEIVWQLHILDSLQAAQQWTAHTREVLLTSAELRNQLLQIEANARGYGLTGKSDFLPPFRAAEAKAPELAAELRRLVSDNHQQRERAADLEEMTRQKVDIANRNVQVFLEARSAIDHDEMTERMLQGKERMDTFNRLVTIFVAEEDRLLTERMSRLQQQQRTSKRVLMIAVGTGILTGTLAVLIFGVSVARRLSLLEAESRRIARGETMSQPAAGTDEISALARALYSASARIHEQMSGLEVLNRDLESFSYSVSHDLRSPLRHIHGFSKILRSDFSAELPAEAQRYLSRIESGAERMGHLIDDLLNFSRIGRRELDRQPVPLFSIVQGIAEELNETAGKKIEWRIQPLPAVQGDAGLIKQVFANLLGNAAKFTRTREHPVIEVGSRVMPQGTAIYVRDNGVGFDMKFADKLFGVFQRLHRMEDFEGTGVGLATVARIVHKHGGTVWADSAPDQGATFFCTLGEPPVAPQIVMPKVELKKEVLYAAAR
jgi:signal transduction histidine kinase